MAAKIYPDLEKVIGSRVHSPKFMFFEMRSWFLSHLREAIAKAQISIRIRAYSPGPLLLVYAQYGSNGSF